MTGVQTCALPIYPRGRLVALTDSLDELLRHPEVELVSLCSPRRRDQARDAIRCLEAGKHVYAEKPCAFTEADLDAILATAARTGRQFHEMAGTAFEQPYFAMRELVATGRLGPVIQVFAQKSYPYFDGRPQDEDIDGGLLRQVGIHAVRMIEHGAGVRVTEVQALETELGNRQRTGLRMAANLQCRLANGGLASIIANYLNQPGFGSWGNETLRIFGEKGFVEATDGGTRTRLVLGEKNCGPLDVSAPVEDYFTRYLKSLRGLDTMPLPLEDELHPTRIVNRAKA